MVYKIFLYKNCYVPKKHTEEYNYKYNTGISSDFINKKLDYNGTSLTHPQSCIMIDLFNSSEIS